MSEAVVKENDKKDATFQQIAVAEKCTPKEILGLIQTRAGKYMLRLLLEESDAKGAILLGMSLSADTLCEVNKIQGYAHGVSAAVEIIVDYAHSEDKPLGD